PSPSVSFLSTLWVLVGVCGSCARAVPQAKVPARTRANRGVVFIGSPPRGWRVAPCAPSAHAARNRGGKDRTRKREIAALRSGGQRQRRHRLIAGRQVRGQRLAPGPDADLFRFAGPERAAGGGIG